MIVCAFIHLTNMCLFVQFTSLQWLDSFSESVWYIIANISDQRCFIAAQLVGVSTHPEPQSLGHHWARGNLD